jgi:hypothetical protein
MRILLVVFGAFAVMVATPAQADRAVTEDESASLAAAVSAEGCSGGKMEFDDRKFEVEDAQCNDGRTYDLDFDASYKLMSKELED